MAGYVWSAVQIRKCQTQLALEEEDLGGGSGSVFRV